MSEKSRWKKITAGVGALLAGGMVAHEVSKDRQDHDTNPAEPARSADTATVTEVPKPNLGAGDDVKIKIPDNEGFGQEIGEETELDLTEIEDGMYEVFPNIKQYTGNYQSLENGDVFFTNTGNEIYITHLLNKDSSPVNTEKILKVVRMEDGSYLLESGPSTTSGAYASVSLEDGAGMTEAMRNFFEFKHYYDESSVVPDLPEDPNTEDKRNQLLTAIAGVDKFISFCDGKDRDAGGPRVFLSAEGRQAKQDFRKMLEQAVHALGE